MLFVENLLALPGADNSAVRQNHAAVEHRQDILNPLRDEYDRDLQGRDLKKQP